MNVIAPPYSDRQMRWAFAAERRGQLPPGTAELWANRNKRRFGDLAVTTVTEHPAGWQHSKASIKKIGQLIEEGSVNPLIRQVAVRITAHLPSKQPTQEIEAIYQWVRSNIRFRYDPIGMEWLQAADRTLKERAGDCDCITILIGSLCQSLGHRALTRTVGASKMAPEHVSALIWDRKRWISLDPVLEGPGDTGQPKPGNFAAYAEGPAIVWDLEGKKMLGNFGVQPTAQELQLWQFMPAFRSETAAPTPDRRYSRAHTPTFGFFGVKYCQSEPSYDGIGYYWLPAEIPGDMHEAYLSGVDGFGAWGFLKKIGKVFSKVAKAVAPIASMIPGVGLAVGPALAVAGSVVGTLSKDKAKRAAAAAAGAAPAAGGAPPASSKAATAATRAITTTPLEIKKVGQAAAEIQKTLLAMQAAQGSAVVYLPKISAAVEALPLTLPNIQSRVNSLITYLKVKDTKALKARANALKKAATKKTAKAQLAAMRKIARSEMSKASVKGKKLQLAGLGLKPSFTMSFGAFADVATARAAAQRAVDRVHVFISKVGKPPEVSLPEVAAFQAADGRLIKDGLYGPNAKRAAEWYLNRAAPPVSARFKNPVTWTPPAAAPVVVPMQPASVAVPRPAPHPAAVVAPKPAPRIIQAPTQIITAPAPRPAPRPAPIAVKPRLAPIAVKPRPTPIAVKPRPAQAIIPTRPTPIVIPAAAAAKPAKKHPALLPTRAEIIRLEIASARGDGALLMELARVARSTTRRAKTAVKKARKTLNGSTTPPTKPEKKTGLTAFWPVLAVLALSDRN